MSAKSLKYLTIVFIIFVGSTYEHIYVNTYMHIYVVHIQSDKLSKYARYKYSHIYMYVCIHAFIWVCTVYVCTYVYEEMFVLVFSTKKFYHYGIILI